MDGNVWLDEAGLKLRRLKSPASVVLSVGAFAGLLDVGLSGLVVILKKDLTLLTLRAEGLGGLARGEAL